MPPTEAAEEAAAVPLVGVRPVGGAGCPGGFWCPVGLGLFFK